MTQPSYVGHVATAFDAVLLFEACLQGHLPVIDQRVDSSDRTRLISSGHIFIYEQQECNIQRWTDGLKWSPSRALDGFLIYRELDGPLPRGSEKRTKPEERSNPEPWERHLYGSLIDSYDFKSDGLIKKTVAVRLGSSTLRLVSYYRAADIMGGTLSTPSVDPNLLWMSFLAERWFTVTDRIHGSQSTYSLGANISTASCLETQDQALDTQYEILQSFRPHDPNQGAGFDAAFWTI